MADANDKVIEAEIVGPAQDDAKLILSLEEMIKNNRELIEKTRGELSEQRDMLKNSFESDAIYQEQNEEVKKATKIRSATKAQILKKPSVAMVAEKVRSLQSQIKEYEAALSDYLREYQRVSGSSTIEGDGGEILEIIYIAKLKRVNR